MEQAKEARIQIEAPLAVTISGPAAYLLKESPSWRDYGVLFLVFVFSGLSFYLSFFTSF